MITDFREWRVHRERATPKGPILLCSQHLLSQGLVLRVWGSGTLSFFVLLTDCGQI